MNKKALMIILALIALVIGIAIAMRGGKPETPPAQNQPVARQPTAPAEQQQPVPSHTSPQMQMPAKETPRVPAYYKTPPSVASLAPVLNPEQFTGPTREAYRAVKAIPQTIAQLPCYCYCDEEHGHKSLHSCFESDHGSQCAVCVNEALMAYRLEKEMKLTPAQIRERIIALYSAEQ